MNLKETFLDLFKTQSEESFFSPGRVNIIGEHIDYNGGLVAPCIIDKGTYAEVSKIDEIKINIYSTNFSKDGIRIINFNDLEYKKEDTWLNYIKGVIKYSMQKGFKPTFGLNILLHGTITNGGLSSSASLEILICKIINKIYNFNLSNLENVLLTVKVENEYIGVSSGIMDQYSIMFGKKDNITLIDCTKKEHEYIPFKLEGKKLLILNTNKKRTLEDSKYNERYEECMRALKILQTKLSVNNLCEITPEEFENNKYLLNDPILEKRVKHVVTEQARVLKMKEALNNSDYNTVYKLMQESHISLKNDYEVTGKHLDSIVEACNETGIIAARMTGAGFGGNAICIINDDELDKIEKIKELYYKKTGINSDIIILQIG